MKVGDLVRAKSCPQNGRDIPIVQKHWVGLIIGWASAYRGSDRTQLARDKKPIVYWNPAFDSEIEYPDQVEVIGDAKR